MSRTLVALVVLPALVGCAIPSGRASFDVKSQVAPSTPVTKLFVYANVKQPAFNDDAFEGFTAQMKRAAAACRVTAEVMHYDPLELDSKAAIARKIDELQPEVVLHVRSAGGEGNYDRYGEASARMVFELQVLDVATSAAIWKAQSSVFMWTDRDGDRDTQMGALYAADIINQLRKDGILCPLPQPRTQAAR